MIRIAVSQIRLQRSCSSTKVNFTYIPKNGLDEKKSAALTRAIAAARPITLIGMLEVNSENSTHRAADEVWFGP